MSMSIRTHTAEVSKPGEFTSDQVQLLKTTICKGASDDEFMLFCHVCKHTGLDPFMKQVFPVKRWDSKLNRECMTIQTSIDGYRLIAERTGKYVPGREPTFAYDSSGKLISATAYVKKQAADKSWHEFAASAYFDEYCQRSKDGKLLQFWLKMPHLMLAKCAEALALRKGFPAELSGLYTAEEMGTDEPVKNKNTVDVKYESSVFDKEPESIVLEEEPVQKPKPFMIEPSQVDYIKELLSTQKEREKPMLESMGLTSIEQMNQVQMLKAIDILSTPIKK